MSPRIKCSNQKSKSKIKSPNKIIDGVLKSTQFASELAKIMYSGYIGIKENALTSIPNKNIAERDNSKYDYIIRINRLNHSISIYNNKSKQWDLYTRLSYL